MRGEGIAREVCPVGVSCQSVAEDEMPEGGCYLREDDLRVLSLRFFMAPPFKIAHLNMQNYPPPNPVFSSLFIEKKN